MNDLAKRFPDNPLLSPTYLTTSKEGLQIARLLNSGAFLFDNKTRLIARVAEKSLQKEGKISFSILSDQHLKIIKFSLNDPVLVVYNKRVINYKDADYSTTLSHLLLLLNEDNIHFYEPEEYPSLFEAPLQSFGIEGFWVTKQDDLYYPTFTAVSCKGIGVDLKNIKNWEYFKLHFGLIRSSHNKYCAIFNKKINNLYYIFHHPSSTDIGGNFIWLASLPDERNWGNHTYILRTKKGSWNSGRVGVASICTDKGWSEIYHGANQQQQYCLRAFLLNLNDHFHMIVCMEDPIMIPSAPHEVSGFFSHVVFINGQIIGPGKNEIVLYYGASDEYVYGVCFSIKEIFSLLKFDHAQ